MKNIMSMVAAIAVVTVWSTPADAYTLYYDWGCTGSYGSAELTLRNDGTFEDSWSGTGTWGQNGTSGYLAYDSGTCPIYVAGLNGMDGYMKSTDGANCGVDPSCFYVTNGATSSGNVTSNGLTPSGDPISLEK